MSRGLFDAGPRGGRAQASAPAASGAARQPGLRLTLAMAAQAQCQPWEDRWDGVLEALEDAARADPSDADSGLALRVVDAARMPAAEARRYKAEFGVNLFEAARHEAGVALFRRLWGALRALERQP